MVPRRPWRPALRTLIERRPEGRAWHTATPEPGDHLPFRPSAADLEAARKKTVEDVLRPGLDILFVGINPGLYTAAIGHHFGRPGNRFWPALSASGLLRAPLTAWESERLLESNIGITNVVRRATASADELAKGELVRGARVLTAKILRAKPRIAAFLGLGLYRDAFDRPRAGLGPQEERIGRTSLWVFPNPSGLNAHFQVRDYVRMFRRMGTALRGRARTSGSGEKGQRLPARAAGARSRARCARPPTSRARSP